MEAVLRRIVSGARLVLAFVACACYAASANAQFNTFEPALRRLTGGLIWGSIGYRDVADRARMTLSGHHPALRGGFAALYGPFGGQPDTSVQLDSVRTTLESLSHSGPAIASSELPDSARGIRSTHSRMAAPGRATWAAVIVGDTIRTVREMRCHYSILGRDGWISLSVGYEYSSAYRVNVSGSEGTLLFHVSGRRALCRRLLRTVSRSPRAARAVLVCRHGCERGTAE